MESLTHVIQYLMFTVHAVADQRYEGERVQTQTAQRCFLQFISEEKNVWNFGLNTKQYPTHASNFQIVCQSVQIYQVSPFSVQSHTTVPGV